MKSKLARASVACIVTVGSMMTGTWLFGPEPSEAIRFLFFISGSAYTYLVFHYAQDWAEQRQPQGEDEFD